MANKRKTTSGNRAARKSSAAPRAAAAAADEPQTRFLNPSEGGTYLRAKDGSLTRIEEPTRPAALVPESAIEQPKARRGRKGAAQAETPPAPPELVPQPTDTAKPADQE